MYSVSNEQFEGPLDLLLQLIEKEKLEITSVSLSKITSDYLKKIEGIKGTSSEMADFLIIAAKLLYLKSKELLPNAESVEDEMEIADLETKLREYSTYKNAALHLESILNEEKRGFKRRAKNEISTTFMPPTDLSHSTLFAVFQDVLNKAPEELEERNVETSTEKKISLADKKVHITSLLKKKKRISFREILINAQNKTEVIVIFLAVLELIKQSEIGVEQEDSFADIHIVGLK